MNRAVRSDAHFSSTDQAAFHRDSVFEHYVFYAFHAAANSRSGANAQVAADYDVLADDLIGANLEVAVMQETLRRRRNQVRGQDQIWWDCILVSDRTPGFNAGSVQPQEGARGMQTYQRVGGNAPSEPAAGIGGELPDRMNPTHHVTRSTQVDICFSENRPITVLFSTRELATRIDVSRKRSFRRRDKVSAHRHQYRMGCVALLQREHQRIIRPAQHNIFLAVRKRAGSRGRIGYTALQDWLQFLDVVAKAGGKITDFSGILLNDLERQGVRLAAQFDERGNQRQHQHDANRDEQNGHCEIGIHKTFRKRSVLSQ